MRASLMKMAVLLGFLIAISVQLTLGLTCPQGQTLVPDADYIPIPNGCGGSQTQSKIDKAVNPFSDTLTTCCNAHDLCFRTCDTTGTAVHSFKECNDDFNSCLKSQCKKKKDFFKEKACLLWAKAYYVAVSEFGGKFYNQAQKLGCSCQ